MPREKLIVVNNATVFGWAFMLVWMAMLIAFTWLALRDGGVPGYSQEFSMLVFGAFWLFGVAGCNFFLRMPRVRLVETPGGLVLDEIWLWKRRAMSLSAADVLSVKVVEEKDTDGDPYFKCAVALSDGRQLILKESHMKEIAEDARIRVSEAFAARFGASYSPRPNVSSKE